MITPKVKSYAKKHYGCESATGIALEDEGTSGTIGSHWDRALVGHEMMTGTQIIDSRYSALTLSLLEDSGWYKADYSQADTLNWGKNKGCEFYNSQCKAKKKFLEYCYNTKNSGCDLYGKEV